MLIKNGIVDFEPDQNIDLTSEIARIKKEKNAIILAHYYQTSDIQDVADFIGDSLELSRKAEINDAEIILFAGVKFMAETAKILAPDKKVLLPDLNAGCSLADSCRADEFRRYREMNPDRTVISYVNTSVEIKAQTDIICTSSNALQIIKSLPGDEKILFAPDKNLGNYIKNQIDRDIIVWDGACHVHEEFSLEAIIELKKQHPGAKIIVHPECQTPVRMIADYIGSTAALLKYTVNNNAMIFIIATEPGIIHQMRKKSPQKLFIPVPAKDSGCGCNECNFMKLITLKKIYNTLKFEQPEIIIDRKLLSQARKPLKRMLEISEKLVL